MRRLLLSLFLLVAFTACNSPTEPFSRADLSGVVKDQYGNVWGGVSVSAVTPGGVAATGVTGNDGRYTIKRITPGHYRVWLQLGPTGPGYFVGDVDLHDGANTFDIVSH